MFRLLCHFSPDLEIPWNYDKAYHFKGPHDGIGGSVKRKVHSDVKSEKAVIKSAKHFAEYAQKVCNISVLYLDNSKINSALLNDSCYIPGTLKIYQVRRATTNEVDFYNNS